MLFVGGVVISQSPRLCISDPTLIDSRSNLIILENCRIGMWFALVLLDDENMPQEFILLNKDGFKELYPEYDPDYMNISDVGNEILTTLNWKSYNNSCSAGNTFFELDSECNIAIVPSYSQVVGIFMPMREEHHVLEQEFGTRNTTTEEGEEKDCYINNISQWYDEWIRVIINQLKTSHIAITGEFCGPIGCCCSLVTSSEKNYNDDELSSSHFNDEESNNNNGSDNYYDPIKYKVSVCFENDVILRGYKDDNKNEINNGNDNFAESSIWAIKLNT